MHKLYKAVKHNVCIKDFFDEPQPGWYESAAEALANFHAELKPAPVAVTMPVTDSPRTEEDQPVAEPTKRRGRPRKE